VESTGHAGSGRVGAQNARVSQNVDLGLPERLRETLTSHVVVEPLCSGNCDWCTGSNVTISIRSRSNRPTLKSFACLTSFTAIDATSDHLSVPWSIELLPEPLLLMRLQIREACSCAPETLSSSLILQNMIAVFVGLSGATLTVRVQTPGSSRGLVYIVLRPLGSVTVVL